MPIPLLKVSNITVRFGGILALNDVSFDVHSGELLGLIGPNGAGKTTLLRSITGACALTSGVVCLSGEHVEHLTMDRRVRKGLALSQQIVKPLRSKSLLLNVALAAGGRWTSSPLKALIRRADKIERAQAQDILDRLGIGAFSDQEPSIQPLGVLKRLEMARALALQPKLLLLDEPLAGLNSKEAARLADTIAAINQSNTTIVLIEHNLTEVMRICHRLVVLDNGRKIADGKPTDVMNNSLVRAAYLGSQHQERSDAAS